jgi:energy-coupling factor transporter ATP-binding protein EcfA2
VTGQPGNDLRIALGSLRDRLHEDLAGLEVLRALRQRKREIDDLLADLDRQLERAQRAAVITLVGATGAGKSTLLNALVGKDIAQEGVDRPTTRRPVIYAPRDADLTQLLAGSVERPEGHESEGEPVVVRYDAGPGPWSAQVLIDAPDMNSIDVQHRAVVSALAERSDVLAVVLHHQSIVEAASASFVDAFAGRRRLVFVLNRIDELTREARADLLAQVREMARQRWNAPDAPIAAISARAARSQPDSEGWSDFCLTLQSLAREGAIGAVRRLNALGLAARLQAIVRDVREEVAPDLGALAEEVAAGLEQLEARVGADVAERLELRRADLREMLSAEAAKRWDGPGGLALRAGGVGTLGLGAGALLLRHSPLIAAGTASGTIVAEQVQRALREQRLGDADVLVPGGGEISGWYAESLSAARLRAARLAGDPERLGVPTSDGMLGRLTSAVQEAWRGLLDRELPAAAEKSWLRLLRLPLDLPVYALGLWVLYQVATGFMDGHYAGFDFLINALLILLAYLYLVRICVRRGLGWRARRLVGDATARVTAVLAEEARRPVAGVAHTATTLLQSLDRLCELEKVWRVRLEQR